MIAQKVAATPPEMTWRTIENSRERGFIFKTHYLNRKWNSIFYSQIKVFFYTFLCLLEKLNIEKRKEFLLDCVYQHKKKMYQSEMPVKMSLISTFLNYTIKTKKHRAKSKFDLNAYLWLGLDRWLLLFWGMFSVSGEVELLWLSGLDDNRISGL